VSGLTTAVTDELIVSHSLVDCPFDDVNVAQWDCNRHGLSYSDAFLIPTAFVKTDPRSAQFLLVTQLISMYRSSWYLIEQCRRIVCRETL